ncbi:MAG: hypothetical protein ORN85_08500 [Sediminibacterium sp.]|nr:hypothetical protein [Sediminibacterium sp.]
MFITFKPNGPVQNYKYEYALLNNNPISLNIIDTIRIPQIKNNVNYQIKYKRFYNVRNNVIGQGTIFSNNTVDSGANIKISFFPNSIYNYLDSIFINDVYVGNDSINSYTIYNVDKDISFRVVYVLKQLQSITTQAANGFITPSAAVPYGTTNYRVTYNPILGYKFVSVLIDGLEVFDSVNGYTFTKITASHTVVVRYIPISLYNISTKIINGNISPAAIVDSNTSYRVTYSSIDSTKYRFLNYSINGSILFTDSSSGYTFYNINNNQIISVVFKRYYQINTIINNGILIQNSTSVDSGDNAIIQFLPIDNNKYRYDYSRVNGQIVVPSNNIITLSNVNENKNVLINYKRFYRLQTSAIKGIITSNNTMADSGEYYRITYSPSNSNYFLDSLVINGVTVSKDSLTGYTYKISGQDTIRAVFSLKKTYTITTQSTDGGTISPTIQTVSASNVVITYKNAGSYSLDSLIVDGMYVKDSNVSYTFYNVRANHNIRVVYKINLKFNIYTNVINGGVSPNVLLDSGSKYRITYQSSNVNQYKFTGIYVNNIFTADSSNGYTINNLNQNTFVTAIFGTAYKVTTSIVNGTILESPQFIDSGSTAVIRYSSYTNGPYKLDKVLVNGNEYPAYNNLVIIPNVNSDLNVQIIFKTQYKITTEIVNGIITPSFNADSLSNPYVLYSALGNGYFLDSVLVDGINYTDSFNRFTFTSVTSDQKIRVVFRQNLIYQILTSVKGGFITPPLTANFSSNVRITYSAAENYAGIDSVIINGINYKDSTQGYTIRNISRDYYIRVVFKAKTRYTITTLSNYGGTIIPTTTIDSGNNFLVTYNPANNYRLLSVIVDGVSIDTALAKSSYLLTNVTSNHTIVVSFIKVYSVNLISVNSIIQGYIPQVDSGTTLILNITSKKGGRYRLDSLSVNGQTTQLVNNNLTINNIDRNYSIYVSYIKQYAITTSVSNGVITPTIVLDSGNSSKFKITYRPSSNLYYADTIYIDNVVNTDSLSSYTFENVVSDHNIVVNYIPSQLYSITTSSSSNANISPSRITFTKETVRITYSVNSGYHLDSIIIDGVNYLDSFDGYTFYNIRANHVVKVVAALGQTYRIATSSYKGTISPSVSVDNGSSYRITYNNNGLINYRLFDLLLNDVSIGTDSVSSYTLTNITMNNKIEAIYYPYYQIQVSVQNGNLISAPTTLDSTRQLLILAQSLQNGSNYRLNQIRNNGVALTYYTQKGDSIFINGINGNSNIVLSYIKQYQITTNITNGTISGGGLRDTGSVIRITYLPKNDSFYFDSLVIGNQVVKDSILGYTFTVNSDQTINVYNSLKKSLSITTAANFGGTISPSQSVQSGQNVIITYQALAGYRVDSVWVDGIYINDTSGSYLFNNVRQNHSIKISFKALKTYRITTRAENGNITSSTTVQPGTSIVIRFSPIDPIKYRLLSLQVNGLEQIASLNEIVISNINQDQDVFVSYVRYYRVALNVINGVILQSRTTADSGTSFNLRFRAVNNNYLLRSITINGVLQNSIDTPLEIKEINKDFDIVVNFTRVYTITTNVVNGLISPTVIVDSGSNYRISYSAFGSSFYLDSVQLNGLNVQDSVTGLTIRNIRVNQNVRVVFKPKNQYIITTSTNNSSGGNLSQSQNVYTNDTIRITYSPNTGFSIDSIIIDGVNQLDSFNGYTFYKVTENHNVRIVFRQGTFYRVATSVVGGNISPSITVNGSSSLRITYQPISAANYYLRYIKVNNVDYSDSVNGITLNNISTNMMVEVYYQRTFIVNSSITNGIIDSITSNGRVQKIGNNMLMVDSGSSIYVRIKAVEPTQYRLQNITVNQSLQNVSDSNLFTINSIRFNASINIKYQRFFVVGITIVNGVFIDNQIVKVDSGLNYTINSQPPSTDYYLDSVIVDGKVINNLNGQYTFTNVQKNHTVRIQYKLKETYTIITSIEDLNGFLSGNISPSINVRTGDNATITYKAFDGYSIIDVLIDGVSYPDSLNSITFNNINKNYEIKVICNLGNYYRITTNAVNGNITEGDNVVLGSDFRVTYRPNGFYRIEYIKIDGQTVNDSIYGYTFRNIIGAHTVEVEYTEIAPSAINVRTQDASCFGERNGVITVSSTIPDSLQVIITKLNGIFTTITKNISSGTYNTGTILDTGAYNVCMSVVREQNNPKTTRCYQVYVNSPSPIIGFSDYESGKEYVELVIHSGNQPLQFTRNNEVVQPELWNNRYKLPLVQGVNIIKVQTDLSCQGSYEDTIIYSSEIYLYPNPADNSLSIHLGNNISLNSTKVILTDINGMEVYNKESTIINGEKVVLDITNLPKGIYLVKVQNNVLRLIKN